MSHAGLALLRHLADKTGLTDAQGIRPAAPPFLDPGWYQGLVGARLAAQAGHGPRLRLVLPALALGRAEREASDLGQQGGPVVPAADDLGELGHRGGGLPFGRLVPVDVPLGGAGQAGHDQPGRVRDVTISSHSTRIEYGDDKGKLAKLVSVCCAPGLGSGWWEG